MRNDFLTLAMTVRLNIHDLNNEAIAGNVADIRLVRLVDENGNAREATGVSGRMLKHWHLAYMRDFELKERPEESRLCRSCRIAEPMRPVFSDETIKKLQKKVSLVEIALAEKEAVQNCIIDDIHGFLSTTATPVRRNSRTMFSWLVPVLASLDARRQALHTRVSREVPVTEEERRAQMLFYKSYASGVYGMVSAFDIERVGYVESSGDYVIDEREQKIRLKRALDSYHLMIGGSIGASLSHALPHAKCEELVVALSTDGPLPNFTSPIYKAYLENYLGMLKYPDKSVNVLAYSSIRSLDDLGESLKESKITFKVFSDIGGIFEYLRNLFGLKS